MALGYEGWVKVGSTFALGTGTSVPRARVRLESSSGYGGQIGPGPATGIGLPFTYDWETWDGSVNFDLAEMFWDELKSWLLARQTAKEVKFSSRQGNQQRFQQAFWNNIGINANEQSLVDGSCSFVAIDRTAYVYGTDTSDLAGWKKGNSEGGLDFTLLCPLATNMPPPLNDNNRSLNPIPAWKTYVEVAGDRIEFLNWSLSFAQDVVKFFACEANTSSQPPKYLAVGPMTVTFNGSYMLRNTFLGDLVDTITVGIGTRTIDLKRCEATTETDDQVSPDAMTPLVVDYAVYEIGV